MDDEVGAREYSVHGRPVGDVGHRRLGARLARGRCQLGADVDPNDPGAPRGQRRADRAADEPARARHRGALPVEGTRRCHRPILILARLVRWSPSRRKPPSPAARLAVRAGAVAVLAASVVVPTHAPALERACRGHDRGRGRGTDVAGGAAPADARARRRAVHASDVGLRDGPRAPLRRSRGPAAPPSDPLPDPGRSRARGGRAAQRPAPAGALAPGRGHEPRPGADPPSTGPGSSSPTPPCSTSSRAIRTVSRAPRASSPPPTTSAAPSTSWSRPRRRGGPRRRATSTRSSTGRPMGRRRRSSVA